MPIKIILKVIATLTCIFWACTSTAQHRRYCTPGQVIDVDEPSMAPVTLSRKGLIAITQPPASSQTGPAWRVTCLKRGVVQASFREPGQPPHRYIFEVAPLPLPERPDSAFPPWICQRPGISCNAQKRTVQGTVDDAEWELEVDKFCARKSCISEVSLAPETREQLRSKLELQVSPHFRVETTPTGRPYLTSECASGKRDELEQWADYLTHGSIKRGLVVFRCKDLEKEVIAYSLRSKIVLWDGSRFDRGGFNSSFSMDLFKSKNLKHASIQSIFSSELSDRKLSIVGSPEVMLLLGVPTKVVSGGELPISERSSDHHRADSEEILWKTFGLTFTSTVIQQHAQQIRISYDLSLKHRLQDSGGGLSSNGIKGEAQVTLSEPLLLGTINMSSAGDQITMPGIFESIPILGPLFRFKEHSSSDTRLSVFVLFERI